MSPRPFVLELVVLLDVHEEPLHLALKTPERGTAQNVIVHVLSPHQVQEAKSVKR